MQKCLSMCHGMEKGSWWLSRMPPSFTRQYTTDNTTTARETNGTHLILVPEHTIWYTRITALDHFFLLIEHILQLNLPISSPSRTHADCEPYLPRQILDFIQTQLDRSFAFARGGSGILKVPE